MAEPTIQNTGPLTAPDPALSRSAADEIIEGSDYNPDEFLKAAEGAINPEPPKPEPAKAQAKPQEPPKPAAKTPEPKPDETQQTAPEPPTEPELPEAPRKAADWKALRTKYDTEIADLKRQLAAGQDTNALTQLQKERDEALGQLRAIAFERSPEFAQKYGRPMDQLTQAIKAAAGDQSSRLSALLIQPQSADRDDAINQAIENMPGIRQNRILNAILKYDELRNEQQSAIDDSRKNWDSLLANRSEQSKQEEQKRRGEFEELFKSEQARWLKLPLFSERQDDQEHNDRVSQMVENAKGILMGDMDSKDAVRASFWAAAGPEFAQDSLAKAKRIEELEAELSQLKGSSPGLKDGGQPPAPGEADEDPLASMERQLRDTGMMR